LYKKNRIFKNIILEKYVCFISFIIPGILSWIFWTIQVSLQSKEHKDVKSNMSQLYQPIHEHKYFRHLYCWFKREINIAIFAVALILIGANIYFSIIKGFSLISKIRGTMLEKHESFGSSTDRKIQRKLTNMNQIKKSLWLYPFISAVLWISFFVFQIVVTKVKGEYLVLSIFTCLLLSIRQLIFDIVFLITQPDIFNKLKECFSCRTKKKSAIDILKDMNEGEKLYE
jgi:hypothetical protein